MAEEVGKWKVVITDHGFTNLENETSILDAAGAEIQVAQSRDEEEIGRAVTDADAVLVQWAPVTAAVIDRMTRCKIIVRYGIGTDNVDLEYARKKGIPVCNVPDYCIEEVANHTLALAMNLQRQLVDIDQRVRDGIWRIVPDRPMPAASDMIFCTAGFGRIAREVLKRAVALGYQCAAVDPFVDDSVFQEAGVVRMLMDEAFENADILSLHLPLITETRHLVGRDSLPKMKEHAIVVNTARGGLVDTVALAETLKRGHLGGAGLDVFETEPLEADHPLRSAPRTILTSHVAWYSESAVPRLQRQAAEEVVRGLRGRPLKNRVNP